MQFLNQTNFPRLWLIFQRLVGGTLDKQKLAISHYNGQKKVLEIGCSVGNVSVAFSQFRTIEFTGIDIDENALAYARERLSYLENFRFEKISLSDLARKGEKFDYVLFANILHHVDDTTAISLLNDVQKLLSEDSTVIIMEPEKIRQGYGTIFKVFYALEKGQFRRHKHELIELVKSAGLSIMSCSEVLVSPDSLPSIKVGRISLIKASLARARLNVKA